jgi:glycine/D-amino acid oxidase-like deaminating enzyme
MARALDALVEARMNDGDHFDIAVIGAGPAGSCAAIAAARAGARVVLVDRGIMPRAKVCGCCLAASGVAALHAAGAGDALAGAVPLRAIRLASGARAMTLARAAGVAIGREELDTRLVDIARCAGVEVRLETSARVSRDSTVRLTHGTRISTLRARTVIVADGLQGSALDDVPGFEWRITARSMMGFGATLPATALDCPFGEIHMHVGRDGYIGVVRLSSGELDVAAAIAPAAIKRVGTVAACARKLLAHAPHDAQAVERARWRGTPQLTRRRIRVAASSRSQAKACRGRLRRDLPPVNSPRRTRTRTSAGLRAARRLSRGQSGAAERSRSRCAARFLFALQSRSARACRSRSSGLRRDLKARCSHEHRDNPRNSHDGSTRAPHARSVACVRRSDHAA